VHNWAQQRAIITPQWKYVSSASPELFDRRSDRAEQHNSANQQRDVGAQLQKQMQDLYDAMIPAAPGQTSLSGDVARRLESLGYVSGGRKLQVDELLTPALADPKDMIDVMMLLKQIRRLVDADRHAEAVPLLEQAAARSPLSADILQQLGRAYLKAERSDDGIATLKKTIDLEPDSHAARRAMEDLYKLYLRNKQSLEATLVLRDALGYFPDDVDLALTLAEILATSVKDAVRNGSEAARIADAVVQSTQGSDVRALTVLASAKAETGDFESAIRHAEKALAIAESNQNPTLIGFIKAQLEAFRTRRPFRNATF
jgi:tetratricopeptide (TPR) repeat protein